VSIGNGTANADLSNDQRVFYRGDVDLYFNILGSHHIRAGYDREDLSTDIVTLANGGGQLTYANGSAADPFGFTTGQYVTRRFFRNGGNFKSQNVAFYIQDNWSLFDNRLTLQLGIRNDRFKNKNIAGGRVSVSPEMFSVTEKPRFMVRSVVTIFQLLPIQTTVLEEQNLIMISSLPSTA
jgi:outer membrane receptor protein involved in Fe transport